MPSTRSGGYGKRDRRRLYCDLESPSVESPPIASQGFELELSSSAYPVTPPRRRRSKAVLCAAVTAFVVVAVGTAIGIAYSRSESGQGAGIFTEIFSYFGIGGDDVPEDVPDVPTYSPTYYPTYSPTSLAEEGGMPSSIAYLADAEGFEEAIAYATRGDESDEVEEAIDEKSEETGEDVTSPPKSFGSYRKFGDGTCADADMVDYSLASFGDFRIKGQVPDDVLSQLLPRIYDIHSAADCPRLCEEAGLNTVGFSYAMSEPRPIPGIDGAEVEIIACSCLVESADLECEDFGNEGIFRECNSDPNGKGPVKFAVEDEGVDSVCYENTNFMAVSPGQVGPLSSKSSKSSKPTPESTEVTAEIPDNLYLDNLYLSMNLDDLYQSMSMSLGEPEVVEAKKEGAKLSNSKSSKSKSSKSKSRS